MPRYKNGQAPLSDLEQLGYQFYLPSGTAARWRELQRLAWEKYGIWLVPSAGWNGYRPLDVQFQYRAELGIMAAVPGTSSHGLTFRGRDMAAIDVNNWRSLAAGESLAWSRFVALCKIVGFIVDFVTPRELWHIGDEAPFDVPAFAAVVINPVTTAMPDPEEDDAMPTIISSPIGQSLAIGGVVVRLPSPDDVKATKTTSGAPLQVLETSAAVHTDIIATAARQDAAAAQLPIVVYANGGDGTVYLWESGKLSYLTDPATLHSLLDRGAATVTWPQGEIDSLRKQQGS